MLQQHILQQAIKKTSVTFLQSSEWNPYATTFYVTLKNKIIWEGGKIRILKYTP